MNAVHRSLGKLSIRRSRAPFVGQRQPCPSSSASSRRTNWQAHRLYTGTSSPQASSSSSASSPPPPPPPSSSTRCSRSTKLFALLGALGLAGTTYFAGALYPPDFATLLSPRAGPPLPSSADLSDPTVQTYVAQLERELQALPVLQRLRAAPDAGEWYETRPYASHPAPHSLTAGALRAPGRLPLLPLVRARQDEKESVVVVYLGRGLCGHEGIIHGGMLATLLDESLGRVAIMNLPERVAVTASLTIDYKAPVRADQFVLLHCRLNEINGRKAFLEGRVEDVHGNVLAYGRALFIQPKYAKLLDTESLQKALGKPPVSGAILTTGGEPAPVPADPVLDAKIKSVHGSHSKS